MCGLFFPRYVKLEMLNTMLGNFGMLCISTQFVNMISSCQNIIWLKQWCCHTAKSHKLRVIQNMVSWVLETFCCCLFVSPKFFQIFVVFFTWRSTTRNSHPSRYKPSTTFNPLFNFLHCLLIFLSWFGAPSQTDTSQGEYGDGRLFKLPTCTGEREGGWDGAQETSAD